MIQPRSRSVCWIGLIWPTPPLYRLWMLKCFVARTNGCAASLRLRWRKRTPSAAWHSAISGSATRLPPTVIAHRDSHDGFDTQ